jgi:hypothetical protein
LMMCLQDKGPVSILSASGGYPAGMHVKHWLKYLTVLIVSV